MTGRERGQGGSPERRRFNNDIVIIAVGALAALGLAIYGVVEGWDSVAIGVCALGSVAGALYISPFGQGGSEPPQSTNPETPPPVENHPQ